MNTTSDDIRRLLRSFGIQADEAIQAHLKRAEAVPVLRLRIVLEDVTDYGGAQTPQPPRLLEVEGQITR
jgi:hypothetical protein